MAADQDLAERVRAGLAGAGTLREIKMFGGIGFMLNGNMVVALSSRGLLFRVGKEGYKDALARPAAQPMEMRGRPMEGYVQVDPAGLGDPALQDWLRLAVAFVKTLPAKAAKPAAPRKKSAPKPKRR